MTMLFLLAPLLAAAAQDAPSPAPTPAPAPVARPAPPPPPPLVRDNKPLVFIASDSTAQAYDERTYPMTGWGQMLPCAVDTARLGVENRAIGGRSTKSFIAEGRWDRLMGDLRKGDVVLIQFGHNDANQQREERWAPAETVYRANLMRFVADVRGKGATPVLITPIAQRLFNEDGTAKAGFAAWSAVVRDIGARQKVKVLDLETLSRRWLERTGAEPAKAFYMNITPEEGYPAYAKGLADNTHLRELGGRGAANLIANAYRDLRLPHWQQVTANHPDLVRTTPLGRRGCH